MIRSNARSLNVSICDVPVTNTWGGLTPSTDTEEISKGLPKPKTLEAPP